MCSSHFSTMHPIPLGPPSSVLCPTQHLADWRRLAGVVAQSLGCDDLSQDFDRRRVLHYYLPVFYWIRQQVADRKTRGKTGPCVV